jgi:hypothetical protein
MLGDIRNPRLMYAKAVMLMAIGLFAGALLILEYPAWRTAALLLICIWAFCRAYYFAFYVIQNYIDPQFRFAGLLAFFRYLRSRRVDSRFPPPQAPR